jgi:thioredoxin 1
LSKLCCEHFCLGWGFDVGHDLGYDGTEPIFALNHQEYDMASQTVVELTDDNFEAEVINSDIPVLVDFWAEWCQPCRMLAPTIDELADEYDGKVKVGKLDTDSSRNVSVKYGISAIPTVLLFKDGEVAKKFVGLTPKDQFQAAMNEVAG